MLLGSWLVHSVTRKQRTGVSSKGDPTYGSATTFAARVEFKRKLVRKSDGVEVACVGSFTTQTPVKYDDIFWLPAVGSSPADDTTSTDAARQPLQIESAETKDGTQFLWQVYF